MIRINHSLKPEDLSHKLHRFWELSGDKIRLIEGRYDAATGSPVFTVNGRYTARGWTEWTQGFQYGSSLLQFDATGDSHFLDAGKKNTAERMAPHVSHTGVHDHGFNNISTYGNLLRLMNEDKMPADPWEKRFYELALKISGAVQANRWTTTRDGGFIFSFNGPHSLFVDTIRSCRILAVSHLLGHMLRGENDTPVDLMQRCVEHLRSTARYSVFYGEGRDRYDVRGRTAHESVFNTRDGNYRCPSTQQGYSGFTTWTRGLAWAMLGFTEQLELMHLLDGSVVKAAGGKEEIIGFMLKAALAVCDYYIDNSPSDGIPYWDTGAPGLQKAGDYLERNADPFNDFEPVDSSAAAIGCQGLLRLGNFLKMSGREKDAVKYLQTGLTILDALLDAPYLSERPDHEGLILHSVYHHPNGWDHIPVGRKVPSGESSMWGDYHAREVALYLQRIIRREPYYTFFNGLI